MSNRRQSVRLQRISIEALKIILVFTIISLTSYLPVKIEEQ